MSKVGDAVALATSPCDYIGRITRIEKDDGVAIVELPPRYVHAFIIKLDQLVSYEEIPNMTDDEIYAMLKPKMDNSVFNGCIKFNLPIIMGFDEIEKVRCYQENEVIKAIALAYRSGYLRAKKGRAFKIGGDKK